MMEQDVDFRNARYDAGGTITCEINHPVFGWIPFTASANDVEAHGITIFESVVESGLALPAENESP